MENEFIKKVKLFNSLSDKQINLIRALIAEEKVNKECEIIKEGDIGKYLYII